MKNPLNIIKYFRRELNYFSEEVKYKRKFQEAFINMQPFRSSIDKRAELGENVKINGGVIIRGKVKLGRGTFINAPSKIVAGKGSEIEIGQFCSIGVFISFYGTDHPINERVATFQTRNGYYADIFSDNSGKKARIKIGSDV